MSRKLKPCPFCGGEVLQHGTEKNMFVCTDPACRALIGFAVASNADDFAKRFNKRTVRRMDNWQLPALACAVVLLFVMAATILFFTVFGSAADQPEQDAHFAACVVTERAESTENVAALYTEADARALAQMAYGECRGVESLVINGKVISGTCQKAATMWVVLNRYDAGYADSIVDVVAAPYQFVGYRASNPVDPELLELAHDVLERWSAEQRGSKDAGRIIPADYLWFVGDGKHNHFSNIYGAGKYYNWQLPDVYAAEEV